MGISKPDDAISLEMIRNYNIKNYKMSSFYDIKNNASVKVSMMTSFCQYTSTQGSL